MNKLAKLESLKQELLKLRKILMKDIIA